MSDINRRGMLRSALGLAATAWLSAAGGGRTLAQSYPSRPVKLISPYAAGGSTDLIARLVADRFGEKLNGSFYVENRPGAGTNIGTEAVLRADPDGYTLLLASTANAANATLYPKLRFNFLRDVEPVGMVGTLPNVLIVTRGFPAKTVAEFIAYAKANPGQVSVALPGIGSPQHLSAALFRAMTDIDVVFVQYKGGGPVMTDVIGGHIQASFSSSAASAEYIAANNVRALGVTSAQRLTLLPDVPSIGETVQGYDASNFYGIVAPKGTPKEVVTALNRELNLGLEDKAFRAKLAPLGIEPQSMSSDGFGALMKNETEKWKKVIESAGIKAE